MSSNSTAAHGRSIRAMPALPAPEAAPAGAGRFGLSSAFANIFSWAPMLSNVTVYLRNMIPERQTREHIRRQRIAAVPVGSSESVKRIYLDINDTTENLSGLKNLTPKSMPGSFPKTPRAPSPRHRKPLKDNISSPRKPLSIPAVAQSQNKPDGIAPAIPKVQAKSSSRPQSWPVKAHHRSIHSKLSKDSKHAKSERNMSTFKAILDMQRVAQNDRRRRLHLAAKSEPRIKHSPEMLARVAASKLLVEQELYLKNHQPLSSGLRPVDLHRVESHLRPKPHPTQEAREKAKAEFESSKNNSSIGGGASQHHPEAQIKEETAGNSHDTESVDPMSVDMSIVEDVPSALPSKHVHVEHNAVHGGLRVRVKEFWKDLPINRDVKKETADGRHLRTTFRHPRASAEQKDTPNALDSTIFDLLAPIDSPHSFPELSSQSPAARVDDSEPSVIEGVTQAFENWQLKDCLELELSTPVQKKREAAARAQKAREEEEKRRVEARKREEAARKKAELEREQEAQRLREEAERAAAKRLINPLSESWKTQLEQVAAKARGEFKRAFDDKTSGKGMSDSQKLAVRQTIQRGIPIGNLSMHDFGTLLAKDFLGSDIGWLNDEIINAYLKLLVQREQEKRGYNKASKAAPPVHAFPSQWHETVKKANSCKAISRWTKRALLGGPQLLGASLVLFPICDGSHWTLLAIFPQERKIEYLDSLYTYGEDRFICWARDWLKVELGELYVEDEWDEVVKRSAKQDNGSDCGAFTSLNALALIQGMEPGEVVTHTNMKDARRQIAATLLQGGAHGEFDF